MDNDKLSATQKFAALIFALLILASFVFIGYRIATKSSYEAREQRQAQLLAISLMETIADKNALTPDLWGKFENDNNLLIIDHRLMRNNWVLKISIDKSDGFVQATASAQSGWNTRSPKSAEYRAKIFSDGKVVYAEESAEESAKMVRAVKAMDRKNTVFFRFPEEIRKFPVTINACVSEYQERDGLRYIVLKLVDD